MNGSQYDPYFNNPDSPINNPVRQSAVMFDAQYQVQNKFATFSNVRVIGTLTVDVDGTLIVNTPTVSLANVSFSGTAGFNGTSTFNAPVIVNHTHMTFNASTTTSAYISFLNSGGSEVIRFEAGTGGFGTISTSEIDFISNTGNKFVEVFGPTAQLADTGGTNALRVTDSGGTEVFAFRSNGQMRQAKPAYVELLGTIAAPTGGGTNTARLYIDTSGGKNRLMVQFNSGTAVQIAIQP